MKLNILRLLVVALACACAVMLISSARAKKPAQEATLNREYAA